MARDTRTQKQRRLEAYAQRQRERDIEQIGRELHLLWWQYEETNNSAGQDRENTEYVDPKLAL